MYICTLFPSKWYRWNVHFEGALWYIVKKLIWHSDMKHVLMSKTKENYPVWNYVCFYLQKSILCPHHQFMPFLQFTFHYFNDHASNHNLFLTKISVKELMQASFPQVLDKLMSYIVLANCPGFLDWICWVACSYFRLTQQNCFCLNVGSKSP